ncbi:MAG: hypothetical protein ACE5FG_03455 [Myxococcota bacterium]
MSAVLRWLAGLSLLCVLPLGCSADRDGDGVLDGADRCSRTPSGRAVDARGCSDVARGLARGSEALLGERRFAAGELWTLRKLLELRPDPKLERLHAEWTERLAGSPTARQRDPEAPAYPLPEDPGRGIRRLYTYILAPFGEPRDRARRFLKDYLSRECHGYVLTHQLLVIPWAEEQGLDLGAELRARREPLLAQIAAEQRQDDRFSDLYAERTALLLAYGTPSYEDATAWIDQLLAAQRDDGSWRHEESTTLEFDGQQGVAFHSAAHTTAFALWALASYLERFGSGPC